MLRGVLSEMLEGAFPVGGIGGQIVALLVGHQGQRGSRVEARQGQDRGQQSPGLGQRERERRSGWECLWQCVRGHRIQADHGVRGHRAGDVGWLLVAPPLSGPGGAASGPGTPTPWVPGARRTKVIWWCQPRHERSS